MSDDPQQAPEKFADEKPYSDDPGVEPEDTPDDPEEEVGEDS